MEKAGFEPALGEFGNWGTLPMSPDFPINRNDFQISQVLVWLAWGASVPKDRLTALRGGSANIAGIAACERKATKAILERKRTASRR